MAETPSGSEAVPSPNGNDSAQPAATGKFDEAAMLRAMAELQPTRNGPSPFNPPSAGTVPEAPSSPVNNFASQGNSVSGSPQAGGSSQAGTSVPPQPPEPTTRFPCHGLLQTYMEHCRPYQLPAPWDHIQVDP